jgi:putative metal-binding protein
MVEVDVRRGSRLLVAVVIVALVCAATAGAASAYEWQNGDVFVGLSTGKYFVYDNAGTLQETDLVQDTGASFAVDCAFDRSGVLHTTAFSFGKIVRFLGPSPHTILAPDVTVGTLPESISFARDGTYYVGHQASPSLWHMTGSGTLIKNFSPTVAASMLDLSADQKTMFYTTRTFADTKVHRYDVTGAGSDLPDFANLAAADGQIADFKLLPPGDGSGGAIVAQSNVIKRLNASGDVVQTYDVTGENSWFGVALDPDGQSFWAQSTAGLVDRFNIASGIVDRGPLPSAANAFGICVKGTRTAALDNAPPSISINSPGDGATFTQGDLIAADFSCADDQFGTGIKSCSGPVGPGQGIDTGTVGPHSFTVNASDIAGNTASATRNYTVVAPKPVDVDGDGFPVGVDCNDGNAKVHPGAFDIPGNKIDENCDGHDAKRPVVGSSITHNWIIRGPAFTAVTFKILKAPRNGRITAICKGKRCHFKKVKVKVRKAGTLNLLKSLRGARHQFRAGQKLEIQITAPGFTGKDIVFKFKNNLKAPGATTRCLPPGSTKPRKC